MSNFDSEIDAALSVDEPIPRERVISWIVATDNSDLATLAKLYRLTNEGYYRIQPELGQEATCALIQRYLLSCIKENITRDDESDHEDANGDDEIETRFEACGLLHAWLRRLVGIESISKIIEGAAQAVTRLFLEGDVDLRISIETAFLEHALETSELRPYFAHWEHDPTLRQAWIPAMEWANAHPDYMQKLSQERLSDE